MDEFELLADLENVERLLRREPRALPSAELRQRVLADFHAELYGRRVQTHRRWLTGIAAALFFGITLTSTYAVVFPTGQNIASPLQELASQIQRITPDISPEEAVRRAMLVEIASRVGCRSSLCDQLKAESLERGIERAVR